MEQIIHQAVLGTRWRSVQSTVKLAFFPHLSDLPGRSRVDIYIFALNSKQVTVHLSPAACCTSGCEIGPGCSWHFLGSFTLLSAGIGLKAPEPQADDNSPHLKQIIYENVQSVIMLLSDSNVSQMHHPLHSPMCRALTYLFWALSKLL